MSAPRHQTAWNSIVAPPSELTSKCKGEVQFIDTLVASGGAVSKLNVKISTGFLMPVCCSETSVNKAALPGPPRRVVLAVSSNPPSGERDSAD
jgi:hypothetical protein